LFTILPDFKHLGWDCLSVISFSRNNLGVSEGNIYIYLPSAGKSTHMVSCYKHLQNYCPCSLNLWSILAAKFLLDSHNEGLNKGLPWLPILQSSTKSNFGQLLWDRSCYMESSHGGWRHCIIQTQKAQELQPWLQCTGPIQVWRGLQKT